MAHSAYKFVILSSELWQALKTDLHQHLEELPSQWSIHQLTPSVVVVVIGSLIMIMKTNFSVTSLPFLIIVQLLCFWWWYSHPYLPYFLEKRKLFQEYNYLGQNYFILQSMLWGPLKTLQTLKQNQKFTLMLS